MVFPTILEILGTSLVLFLIPGLLLVRLVARGKFDDAPVAVAFAVGTCWTCLWGLLFTGLVGLVAQVHLTAGLLAGIGLGTIGACIVALRLVEGGFGFVRKTLVEQVRNAWSPGLALFLGLVALAWLLSYDSTLFDQERCVSRAGVLPVFDYLTADPPVGFNGCLDCFRGRNAFFVWNGGQRHGPTVFVAPFMVLFGFAGFHLVHLFFGLLTAWFGFHLGRSLLDRPALGYLVGAILSLNPAVLSIPLEDENTMSLGLGTAMFYFLFRRRTQWFFAGMFFGLLLGIRHVGILSILALLVAVWKASVLPHYDAPWVARVFGRGIAANLVFAILGTLLFASPCAIAHVIRYLSGGPLFESFISMPPAQHSFLGMDFTIRGLLSWPFVPEPLRSPYNGFPTLAAFPLTLLRAFGIVGIALVPLGLWWGWRRKRTAVLAGMLWFLPQLAMLCTMANWVEPNKMGVYLSFAQPIGWTVAMGIVALVETWAPLVRGAAARWIPRLLPDNPSAIPRVCRVSATGILVGCMLLLAVFQSLAARWEAPVDQRNFAARVEYIFQDYTITPPMLAAAEPAYARLDRMRLTERSLLPDYGLCRDLWTPELLSQRWQSLMDDLSAPRLADFQERPKDILHTLSGTPAPPLRTLEGIVGPDLRRGSTVLLADLMHRPLSTLRDALRNAPLPCESCMLGRASMSGPTPGKGQIIRFDLSVPPSSGGRFVSSESGRSPPVAVGNRVAVATDLAVPWADGLPCHLAVIPVRDTLYWVMLWYGRYTFDHLADRKDVIWLKAADYNDLSFEVSPGAVLRINEVTSVEPSRFHVWTALATPSLPLWGPVPSSY
jgi:hypothetical protein